jgi:hypothetical protein
MFNKRSPRVGAIIFGFLIWFAAVLIPDPNALSRMLVAKCLI